MKEEDLTDNDNLQLFILIAMFLNIQVMLLLLAKVCIIIIIIITCCLVKLLCYLNKIIKTKLPTSYNNRPV